MEVETSYAVTTYAVPRPGGPVNITMKVNARQALSFGPIF
jgi:hypothetical protein